MIVNVNIINLLWQKPTYKYQKDILQRYPFILTYTSEASIKK